MNAMPIKVRPRFSSSKMHLTQKQAAEQHHAAVTRNYAVDPRLGI